MDPRIRLFDEFLRQPSRKRYARVVREFYAFVWSVALRVSGHREDALDLTHDLFLSLLLRPPAPGSVRSPRGYLARRILTLARRARESAERRRARELEAAGRLARSSGLEADDIEELRTEIDRLPGRVREAVELRYVAGLSNREIAAILSVSERSVEDDLRRGREVLRARLRRETLAVLPGALLPGGGAKGAAPPPADLLPDLLRLIDFTASLPAAAGTAAPAAAVSTAIGGLLVKKLVIASIAALLVATVVGLFTLNTLRRDATRAPQVARVAPPGPEERTRDTRAGGAGDSPTDDSAQLEPASVPLVGLVLWDDTEEPVAGATVALRLPGQARAAPSSARSSRSPSPSSPTESPESLYESTTDASGVARVLHPSSWTSSVLEARVRGEVRASMALALPQAEPVLVRIPRTPSPGGAVVRGRVLDAATGAPVAEGTVAIGEPARSAETDPWGRYEIAGLTEGRYRVHADSPEHLETSVPVEIVADVEAEIDFTLDPVVPLEVSVVDEDGLPLPDVTVTRAQVDGSYLGAEESARTTGPDGIAIIDDVSRLKPQQIRAEKPGYKTAWEKPQLPEPDAGFAEIRVVMRREELLDRAIRGRVVDDNRRAVEGARVTWAPTWGQAAEREVALTAGDGSFELRFTTDHETCHVFATASGWAPGVLRKVRPGSPERPAEVEIVLPAGHWLEGTVVDEEGRPVPGASVTVMPDRELLDSPPSRPAAARRATTDGSGFFSLDDLPGPTVAIEADGPDSDNWSATLIDAIAVDQHVTLTIAKPGVIRGRVVAGATGEPVSMFSVKLKPLGKGWPRGLWYPRTEEGETFASPSGGFVLENVPRSHAYAITIEARGYLPAVVEPLSPERDGEASEHLVELVRGTLLSGIIVEEATAEPIAGAAVLFAVWERDADPSDSEGWTRKRNNQRQITEEDGRFEFRESEAGAILVLASGYERLLVAPDAREAYRDRPGSDLRIPLRPGALLEGTHYEDGVPKAGLYVDLLRIRVDHLLAGPRMDWLGGSKTDAEGAFGWDSLAAGDYLVHHYRKPKESVSPRRPSLRLFQKLTLVPGEHRRITSGDDLGSVVFSGRLLDADDEPAQGFEVSLQPLFPWKYSELTTEVDGQRGGRFRLDVLVRGRYAVGITKDFKRTALRTIDLQDDMEVDLHLSEEDELSR